MKLVPDKKSGGMILVKEYNHDCNGKFPLINQITDVINRKRSIDGIMINDKYVQASQTLYYDPDQDLGQHGNNNIGIMKINNTSISIKEILHTSTLKSKRNEGCRPRIYPPPSIVADLNPVVIDNTFGEVVRIKFSEDVEN